MHVTTGAKVLSIISIVSIVFGLLQLLFVPMAAWLVVFSVAFSIAQLVALFLVFPSIRQTKAQLMVPVVALQAASCILVVLYIIASIVAAVAPESNFGKGLLEMLYTFDVTGAMKTAITDSKLSEADFTRFMAIYMAVMMSIALLFSLWFLSVFVGCWNYIKRLQFTPVYRNEKDASAPPAYPYEA